MDICPNSYWLISSNTFKASVAINAAGKDMGPHTALIAIGNVTERTTKHTEFNCKTWTTEISDFWWANSSECGRKSHLIAEMNMDQVPFDESIFLST